MKTKSMLFLVLLLLAALFALSGCGSAPVTDESPADARVSSDAVNDAAAEAPPAPIYGHQIADGQYEITVQSSSSMFQVVKCILTVEAGEMTAAMTMSGQGYGYLYMGTAEEALADSADTYIPFVLDAEEMKTFTVPVEALDLDTDCAAWSIRKEAWYDRVLVFDSAAIPEDALTLE